MKPLKQTVRGLLPTAIRHGFDMALAAWKSRKFASARRTAQLAGQVSPEWRTRIDVTKASADNEAIPRVPDAGAVRNGRMTMHNGIQVGALSYCGAGIMNLLMENQGVHEPQEERAFGDVLEHVESGGVMLELGAYWGFYSLWFAQESPGARCLLVEPHPANILAGKQNFEMNGRSGKFHRAYVGASEGVAPDGVPTITVDAFCRRERIKRLSVLHADIQGAEADMLAGANAMLASRSIDYVFVSTHSDALHAQCTRLLEGHGYRILASADLRESYSVDGVLVARSPETRGPERLAISHRRQPHAAAA